MTPIQRSVCIYCGSRTGRNPVYVHAARALGEALARADYKLVYGAGDQGIMGETARAAQAAGARITGFIPRHLFDLEVAPSTAAHRRHRGGAASRRAIQTTRPVPPE